MHIDANLNATCNSPPNQWLDNCQHSRTHSMSWHILAHLGTSWVLNQRASPPWQVQASPWGAPWPHWASVLSPSLGTSASTSPWHKRDRTRGPDGPQKGYKRPRIYPSLGSELNWDVKCIRVSRNVFGHDLGNHCARHPKPVKISS